MKYKAFKITPVKRAVERVSVSNKGGNFQNILDSYGDSIQSASRKSVSLPIFRPPNLAVLAEANQ